MRWADVGEALEAPHGFLRAPPRASDSCSARGETAQHLYLKGLVATLVRQAEGWSADLEAYPAAGDVEDWRADVLAHGPDGRRIAFEVQLSGMSEEVGRQRTERYARDGIETIWVAAKGTVWLWLVPGVRIDLGAATLESGAPKPLEVTEGIAQWHALGGDAGAWRGTNATFADVVAGILAGTVRRIDVPWVSYQRDHGGELRPQSCMAATVLTTRRHIEAFEDWQRREEEKRRQELQFEANSRAIAERRARLLPHAYAAASAAVAFNAASVVWLGIPATPVFHPNQVTAAVAKGNEKTGFGLAVWVGGNDTRELFAVVAPTAGRLSESLGTSWSRRGVQVWAESDAEVVAIARALGWGLSHPLLCLPGDAVGT